MGPSNSVGRGSRLYTALALILFVLHAALLLPVPANSVTKLLSNVIQLAAAVLAAVACLNASRRFNGFGKPFWVLISTGFFTWSSAQLMATYSDSILHTPLHQPWPSDVVFFLSMSPLFLTLFLDTDRGFEWQDWPRVFDVIQVIIFALAGYLFSFYTVPDWQRGWGELTKFSWVPETGQNLLMVVAFIFSAFLAQQELARDLYGRLAIFSFLYLSGNGPHLYLESTKDLGTGTLWDLGYSVPFLTGAVLAAWSHPIGEVAPNESDFRSIERRWSHLALVHTVSIIFPLLVLLMAAGFAKKQLLLAIVVVLMSFACSTARIIVGEKQLRESAGALEERNALLRDVFEGTGDALFIQDREGRYVITNRSFAATMNTTPAQLFGKCAAQLTDPTTTARMEEQDRAVVESGHSQTFEYETTTSDGPRRFLATKSPRLDASGNIIGVIGVVRDITEYRALEGRLQQSQKMEAVGNLAGGIAHDFNNLLTVIRGYCSMWLDREQIDGSALKQIQQIDAAASRAAALTSQLLAFSRRQVLQPRVLDLNHIVQDLQKLLHPLLTEDIEILTVLDPKLSSVKADQSQMEQVIMNLVVNARDAMPEGGKLTIETANVILDEKYSKERNIAPLGAAVMLAISDNGHGIEKKLLARIFDPFFTTKPQGKGTGLGLATVYGIIKQSGGYIWVYSEPGRGTSFKIYLPRVNEAPTPLKLTPERVPARGAETILLVEDDDALREMVRMILTESGYSVLSAKTPETALQVCRQNAGAIRMMLTDVIMPGMNGRELARHVSAEWPGTRVLFMSGYTTNAIVHQGVLDSDVDFLQKPFTAEALRARVRQVLDR